MDEQPQLFYEPVIYLKKIGMLSSVIFDIVRKILMAV